MFHACPLTTLDLRSFDTSNVTDMYWMFIDSSVKTIYASEKWSTASVKSSREMFKGCQNLVGGMGTKYDSKHIDHEYARIDGGLCDPGYLTGEYQNGKPEPYAVLKDSTLTFYYDWNKNCREGDIYDVTNESGVWISTDSLDIRKKVAKAVFDTSYADYYPLSARFLFYRCENMQIIESIKNLQTESTEDMWGMFDRCYTLKNIDLSHFNTSNAKYMAYMFCLCRSLTTLDLRTFDTRNVETIGLMFAGLINLKTLDLSNFDTQKLTSLVQVFEGCGALEELNISSFNTSHVKGMTALFRDCRSLRKLDLSNFNTRNVEEMSSIFRNCISLEEVDLTSFDTHNMHYMDHMFYKCYKLRTVYVSNLWNTDRVIPRADDYGPFEGCTKLVGGQGTTYDSAHTDHTYAHIDGGPSNPGYFTYKEYDETKGVEDVRVTGRMENEAMYNLQGIRLKEPVKGLYIKNGKKYLKR